MLAAKERTLSHWMNLANKEPAVPAEKPVPPCLMERPVLKNGEPDKSNRLRRFD